MLKKILTLCLVLCMLASVPAFAALEDIAGEKFEKEISLLNSIGIVQGKEANAYKPADKLTRAEMTTIVLRLIDVEPTVPAAFEDVAADHWASKVIGSAAQLGIINGMSATTFAPEENVTYPQAAKMLVCTLGYGVKAEGLGGYPTGYIAVASQLGVLKSTSDDGQPISRAVMAKMVANCLEVDLMERTGYGSEVTFEAQPGVNLLNKYLDIKIFEGTIDGSYTLNLGGAACEEDEVAIGTDVIKVGETNAASFIGRAVTIYAKENVDEETFTALQVETKKNSEYFTIDAEDVLPATSATELWYEVNEVKEMIEISDTCTWINNSTVVFPIDLTSVSGKITVSSANGEEADIIFVDSFQDAIVEKVSKATGAITFKKAINKPTSGTVRVITLDEDNKSIKFSLTDKDGKEVKVADLKEWDVLSITMNGDMTLFNIVVSTENVTGKIIEYSASEDVAVVGEKEYEIASSLVLDDGSTVAAGVGVEAKFYMNYLGKVVAADTEGVERNYKYGYIVRYAKGEGMEAQETVKIFTEDGAMKVFTLDEDYEIINTPTSIDTLSFEGGSLSAEMLLKYSVDKDGLIYRFETLAAPKTKLGNLIGGSRSFMNGGYILPDNTVIFSVAPSYTGNDSFYSISMGSDAAHWTSPFNYAYEVEDMKVGVGLNKKEQSGIGTVIAVVDKVSKVINADGDNVTRVRLVGGKSIDFDPAISKIEYVLTAFTSEKDVPNRTNRQYGWTGAIGPTNTNSIWTDPKSTVKFEDSLGNLLSADALNRGDVILYATPNQSGVSSMIRIVFRANHAPYMPEYADVSGTVSAETYDMTPFFANRTMGFDDDPNYKGYVSAAGYNQYAMYYVDHMDSISSEVMSFTTAGYSLDKRPLNINDVWNTAASGYAAPATETLNLSKVRACYLYDMERGTIVESSVAEITEEDKVFFRETNGTPVLVVIYRNMPAQ